MEPQYKQDENDSTKVISIKTETVSVDPVALEKIKNKLQDKVDAIQAQLDAIYAQVPEVKPLEDNT